MRQKTFCITIKSIRKNQVVDYDGRKWDRDFFGKKLLYNGQQFKLINKFKRDGFNSIRIVSYMKKGMKKINIPIDECSACGKPINPERGIFNFK